MTKAASLQPPEPCIGARQRTNARASTWHVPQRVAWADVASAALGYWHWHDVSTHGNGAFKGRFWPDASLLEVFKHDLVFDNPSKKVMPEEN